MKKIKKIKIKINGKVKSISDNYSVLDLVKNLKIPIKKVAIELNQEIIDKKKI
ncbi:MAG: thiamine biosynthesis protein ThiS, partial [Flavobacteriaceae bacterium]|nr:thiamine biosynthesis protein ThiS [Flavobacteriaceae bacterium]